MKIACIGGGTGTTAVLKGLKEYSDIELSIIVTMMDDGGSNAIVRDEFGILPLSDVRKSILALASTNKNEILRQLFTYRFAKGNGISGHTLGNLIMIALTDITGSEKEAIQQSANIFSAKGKILPVTFTHTRLVANYDDGEVLLGEHNIDDSTNLTRIKKLSLNTNAKANPDVLKAIKEADYIIVGPGDIYTSILPNILVDGVSKAISKSKGKLIYISNLMSKKGETRGMTHFDLLKEIEKYCNRKMDYVLINNSKIPRSLLKKYLDDGEHPFIDDIDNTKKEDRKILRADLISTEKIKKEKGDTLKRSYIRHDPEKLGKELYYIFRRSVFDILANIINS